MSEPDAEPARARGGRPPRAGTPAPTIYDIARSAGVNPSTVSRALSTPGRISPTTEKRIREAAQQLGYRVNPMARALPTGRTQTLGLIVTDITNPVFFDVVRGAEHAAAAAGYTLVFAESEESSDREAAAAERVAPSVDGLVLVSSRLSDEQIHALAERKPLVLINREVEGIAGISADLQPGIDQALSHLCALGHRSIAYLSGPVDSWMSRARWDRLLTAARARGMKIVEIGPADPTLEGGFRSFPIIIGSGVTAVLAYNDLMAIGLLRAAQHNRLRVPERLSLVGFDDIFGSDFTSPPLTTVTTPLRLLGSLAVEVLLGRNSDGDDRRSELDPRFADITTELVIRGSTGAVHRPQ